LKVLATGAGGFIGSHVVEALVQKNHDVWLASGQQSKRLRLAKSEVERFFVRLAFAV
jgi:nucleoside-diphosphate-sugar epimerase